jgi:superfamily II DNA or RNA helicase
MPNAPQCIGKITRYGYIIDKKELTGKQLKFIRGELLVKPFRMKQYDFGNDNMFPVYHENAEMIKIPKYYGIEKFGNPKNNKLNVMKYETINIEYKGLLRPRQEVITSNVYKGMDENGGGLMLAGCGTGKTNMGIHAIARYKVPTLIIVHKTFLMEQFIDRLITFTNIKRRDIGILQQKKEELDKPIVIATIQSLLKKDLSDERYKRFGFILIDEVHHMGARNFSRFFLQMTTKYMLGISAERQRADGLYKIINWFMGPILHYEKQPVNENVIVKRYFYRSLDEKHCRIIHHKNIEDFNRSKMVTNLINIPMRNKFIYKSILELFDQGKTILFLSGRLDHIMIIRKMLRKNEYLKGSYGLYLGGMKKEDLKRSSVKQIILASYEMASEGLDIPGLNVVIFGTPKSNIRQSASRILRKEEYEEPPIMIDIIDDFSKYVKNAGDNIFLKQSRTREAYFTKQHYNIQDFLLTEEEEHKTRKYCLDKEFIIESLRKPGDKSQKKPIKTKENVIDYSKVKFLD